jgi:serine/threonine-protein kinase
MGISLYDLVTGQRPFRADSDFAVMVAHLKEMPRPPIELKPELGAELNEIIMTSIMKDPAARFQSADEFRTALVALYTAPATAGLSTPAFGSPLPSDVATRRLAAEQAPTMIDPPPLPAAAAATARPPTPPSAAVIVPPVGSETPMPEVPPMNMPPSVVKTGHPALYVVLGGVLVLGALIGAGLYIGRADAEPGATTTPPASPPATSPALSPQLSTPPANAVTTPAPPPDAPTALAPSPAAAPTDPSATTASTSPAPSSSSAATNPATLAPTGAASGGNSMAPGPATGVTRPASGTARTNAVRTPAAAAESRAPVSEPPAQSVAAEFDELESEVDLLQTRAAAVNSSLDNLRQEQARLGLGLRGDIAGRQEAMNLNLTRAREAIGQRNLTRLQRFKTLAEGDIEALERFLGR